VSAAPGEVPSAGAGAVATRRAGDGVLITPMRRRHLRGVMAIEEAVNPRPWSLGLFLGELRLPLSRRYLVALDGFRVAGFAGLMITGDEGHVTNVAVHPDDRRRAVATRLLLVLLRDGVTRGVRDVTLEVRMSNTGAQELYRRFGFAPGGVRPNYYRELGEDALIMWAHGLDTPGMQARLDRIEAELPHPLVEEVTGRG
jgi:ribosomal-protein-alanine N-acetyltransferase